MTEDILGEIVELLDPALVSPLVAYLASEDCEVTGEIYSAAGGLVSRFFVGLTPGYYNPKLTAEDIADNLAEIRAEEGYIVPTELTGEIEKIAKVLDGKR